jgi:hypothetical protein
MKTLILLNVLLGAACATFGQGVIFFANAALGVVDAPVTNAAGNRILGPGPYVADFFWSANTNASMDSLAPLGVNAPFYTNSAQAGYFVGRAVTLPGVGVGVRVLAQVRVWDTTYGATYGEARDNGGEFGFSNLLLALTDLPPGQPPALVGLEGFQLQVIPEPSPAALLVFGGCLALFRRRLCY